jgi:hypothetical protein
MNADAAQMNVFQTQSIDRAHGSMDTNTLNQGLRSSAFHPRSSAFPKLFFKK